MIFKTGVITRVCPLLTYFVVGGVPLFLLMKLGGMFCIEFYRILILNSIKLIMIQINNNYIDQMLIYYHCKHFSKYSPTGWIMMMLYNMQCFIPVKNLEYFVAIIDYFDDLY